MSLNWKEIDLVLDELSLKGSLVREIHQPAHDRLVFSLFNSGRHFSILVCVSASHPRIHIITERPVNPLKPYRFAAFLRAHLRGGRIENAAQVNGERIVRIDVGRAGESLTLWLRLWGAAANVIVTDASGTILDAFYRRPKRGEVSGARFDPLHAIAGRPGRPRKEVEYFPRELPGEGSFNERLERHYRDLESRGDVQRIREEIEADLDVRESKVTANLEKLEKRLLEYRGLERFKELGDLLTSALHRIRKGDRWVKVDDFFHADAPVDIELKPEVSPARNAESYYERYRKARDGMGKVKEEVERLHRALDEIKEKRRALAEATSRGTGVDPEEIAKLRKAARRGKSAVAADTPGLVFHSPPYRILVGRSAAENDELLRRAVRGNDWWFHSRDWPGAYVFVRAAQGKSLPLEVMLDAGNLAIHFSKGKSSGGGDVYYTRVKYLRRVKGGKKGLVIPTQEKNIRIRLEQARIEKLKAGEQSDTT